jgi:predicted DNA-binding protein
MEQQDRVLQRMHIRKIVRVRVLVEVHQDTVEDLKLAVKSLVEVNHGEYALVKSTAAAIQLPGP